MINKVKGYRVMCGFTQADIAEELNITRRTYTRKELNNDFSTIEANKIVEKLRKVNPTIKYGDIFLNDEFIETKHSC